MASIRSPVMSIFENDEARTAKQSLFRGIRASMSESPQQRLTGSAA